MKASILAIKSLALTEDDRRIWRWVKMANHRSTWFSHGE